jgi:hypothetical protein
MHVCGMAKGSSDPFEQLRALAESGRRIKLAPGVVGKTSQVLLGLLAIWAVILWRLSPGEPWFSGALLLVGAVLTGLFYVWSGQMQTFAKENPALALMEGADITEYKRFEAQAKGNVAIALTPPVADPDQPVVAIDPPGPDRQ